ncbi:hypothetical protein [Alkalicoccus chagannorensis]|uniref:hypothetical protein n=1 Tax=Alkalicoccus chagannorensis TaxID=427072 RepID=UPI000407E008|nr:hypothetical protein [Alkalicoccus chagannorensis]
MVNAKDLGRQYHHLRGSFEEAMVNRGKAFLEENGLDPDDVKAVVESAQLDARLQEVYAMYLAGKGNVKEGMLPQHMLDKVKEAEKVKTGERTDGRMYHLVRAYKSEWTRKQALESDPVLREKVEARRKRRADKRDKLEKI